MKARIFGKILNSYEVSVPETFLIVSNSIIKTVKIKFSDDNSVAFTEGALGSKKVVRKYVTKQTFMSNYYSRILSDEAVNVIRRGDF